MPRDATQTRKRIVDAAISLFYSEGIRRVSVDAVAEKAGVTKRTLYYHFRSKDDLIAAYLDARDQPGLALMARWFDEAGGDMPDKIEAIFTNIAKSARHPKWKGCGFLRTAAELASTPGHPAVKVGAAHKRKFEDWICEQLGDDGLANAPLLARQIVLLLDGAFSIMLIHRDPSYIEDAGRAASALVSSAR
ncbi:MAG: TetR/AcrR family transcriptional regulator [Hyphomicrobiaceae bacterium]|nr:TetR/AcrR family transcriptional regulator [Hyphomicrobiaceae bacterium]